MQCEEVEIPPYHDGIFTNQAELWFAPPQNAPVGMTMWGGSHAEGSGGRHAFV